MSDYTEEDLRQRVRYVMGEVRCPYPQPSHEHDDSDCRICALEQRIRMALVEVHAEARRELQEALDHVYEHAVAAEQLNRENIDLACELSRVIEGCKTSKEPEFTLGLEARREAIRQSERETCERIVDDVRAKARAAGIGPEGGN